MLKFSDAQKKFKEDEIGELAKSDDGMMFLKLRSLSRKHQLSYLINKAGLDFRNVPFKGSGWLEKLYEMRLDVNFVDNTIKEIYNEERNERRKCEENLVSELYKINSFEWGGLHQNSLERTIVNRYVKKITSYEILHSAIEGEIHSSMRSYVLASWYNHWTSIIIEDIFNDHKNVLPAIGRIKKIDFFVKNKPFDLKVTYLPEGYIKERRNALNLRPELTLLKRMSRKLDIVFDENSSNSFLLSDLWGKLDDHPDPIAKELIFSLQSRREEILKDCIEYPEYLALWLYENQGTRRFDASNRLFLILVDKNNFFDSWKLKRARPLIAKTINNYLDNVHGDIGFVLNFDWQGTTYKVETDIIFVVKP